MKKLTLLFSMAALFMLGCNQAPKQSDAEENSMEDVVAVTIEELLAAPADFEGKTIAVKGMVTHVCRHGGQKCFVLAEDGETQLRINTSEKIDEFDIALEGSTIEFLGEFKVLTEVQADALVEDHESKAHHATEMAHTEAEKASYFVEAVRYSEISD